MAAVLRPGGWPFRKHLGGGGRRGSDQMKDVLPVPMAHSTLLRMRDSVYLCLSTRQQCSIKQACASCMSPAHAHSQKTVTPHSPPTSHSLCQQHFSKTTLTVPCACFNPVLASMPMQQPCQLNATPVPTHLYLVLTMMLLTISFSPTVAMAPAARLRATKADALAYSSSSSSGSTGSGSKQIIRAEQVRTTSNPAKLLSF